MRRRIVLASLALLLVVLVVAWWLAAPMRAFDPATIANFRSNLPSPPLAFVIVVAIYVVLGFVAAPTSLLMGLTFLCFGTTQGLVFAYAGMLANGCAVRAAARGLARETVVAWLERRQDSRIAVLQRRMAQRGLLTIAAMRLTPIPYTIQNVVAGIAGVRLFDFVVGTLIGLVPAMIVIAGVTSQVDAWIDDPQASRIVVLGVVGVIGVALLGWLARRGLRD
jgi:phospholipase D1/2